MMDIKKGGEGKICIALIWFEGGMGKMERLTSYKNECKREMICRQECSELCQSTPALYQH